MKQRITSAKFQALGILLIVLASAFQMLGQSGGSSSRTSPLPNPTGHVNDYAGVIDAATADQIETKLRAFKEKYGVEIAVAVVKTTGDRPIFEYSLAVARGWGIGSKEDDNPGALLFVAIDDRKYFTQISKDLEDELPDGIAGNLQRQFLVPEFRKGNYAKGISDTIDAYLYTIESKLTGTAPNLPAAENDDSAVSQTAFSTFCCLAIILLIIVIILANRGQNTKNKNDHDRWGGGGFGGGGGGILPWIILGGSGGSSSDSSSSSWDWGSSSGGSDWGGFGGGGDFGGGGAGGDW